MNQANPHNNVDLSILACYAHPDDEQGIVGTLRKSLEAGVRVGLICATRGEVGEIAEPRLATPETLGAVREGELRRAATIIGIPQENVYFLDYRDSGMDGTPENKDPRAFVNADENEAVGKIVKIIRAFKPTLLITFDSTGGYGHPDHIAIHRWTTRAFHEAGDAVYHPETGMPFAPRRLYYASIPRTMRQKMVTQMKELGIESVFDRIPEDKFGMADELITNRVHVPEYVQLKRQALDAHATQINPNGLFAKIPAEMWDELRSEEVFQLAAGDALPAGADASDLFAGLRG